MDASNLSFKILAEACKRGKSFSKLPTAPAKTSELCKEEHDIGCYGSYDDEDGEAYQQIFSRQWQGEGAHGTTNADDTNTEDTDGLRFGTTHDEEKRAGECNNVNYAAAVATPAVVARGTPPTSYPCYCCGVVTGVEVQSPQQVFGVAYAIDGEMAAIASIVDMAKFLEEGNVSEVTRRTSVCHTVGCMLGQGVLNPDSYEAWVRSDKRPQLEKGTDRKDQGLTLADNVIFLRCLAVQKPKIVTDAQLRALFKWVVAHSQFVQEREKRFIATAMAVAENPTTFGYQFADGQGFVNKMASFTARYLLQIAFPFILRMDLTAARWKSGVNCILETAMPKSYDVVYAYMCEDNWIAQGSPVENGRRVHRVVKGAAHATLFQAIGFKDALKAAITANPTYAMLFAGAAVTNIARTSTHTSRDMKNLTKLVSGKRATTVGHGVSGMPTCGARQNNSGVHPIPRYRSIFKADGADDAECDAMVDLFMQKHDNGNTVGFEKHSPKDPLSLSKACAVLRSVELYVPPTIVPATNKRREMVEQTPTFMELKKNNGFKKRIRFM